MLEDICVKSQRERERDPLMAVTRRRRHEKRSINQLVARRVSFAALDEFLDLLERPGTIAECWHGHNLLGG
jgi:hypothetical protein